MAAQKILVVDDEARMRKLVSDFLTRDGFEVLEAEDGEKAMDLFYSEKDIALVIGNEGNGMSEEALAVTDQNVFIPMHTGMESLNAAVAAGILMYKSVER